MRHCSVWILAVVLLSTCIGCGGPYYTMEGSRQAKMLVVHDGEKQIKIHMGTGIGGALTGDAVDPDGNFALEVDGVSIEGSVDELQRVHVDSVTYKDKELGLGTMADI